jgi:beta-galactosidase
MSRILLNLLPCIVWVCVLTHTHAESLNVTNGQFFLAGQPFQVLSGEMHYSRIPREYWADRMQKARAMGLNTISTYVFWNLHEPRPGEFAFDGQRDIASFVRAAQAAGLKVILKPGPYVCAEWDLGGLPSWLLSDSGVKLRTTDAKFMQPVERYLRRLARELANLQASQGGPIILIQLENEYGFCGEDKEYMAKLRDLYRAAGFTENLFTTDGVGNIGGVGSLPDLIGAVNGDDNVPTALDALRSHRAANPLFCAEYWVGWFDSWGRPHQRVDAGSRARQLDAMLGRGASVNLYMFHGGTTFGFMNGANTYRGTRSLPCTTSYDYDAPLDEAGRPTAKFNAFRDVISKHLAPGVVVPPLPTALPVIEIPSFDLPDVASFDAALGESVVSEKPLSMEDLKQADGYMLYSTKLVGPKSGTLKVEKLHDYAVVLLNDQVQGILDRFRTAADTVDLAVTGGQARLTILVENTGRVNFGPAMREERKGILGGVFFGGQAVTGWTNTPLLLDDVTRLHFSARAESSPAFRRGTFMLTAVGDTFLDMRGWGKGVIWVNGHNLGRFWQAGPQQTLFCPAPWLKLGANQVVVFETESGAKRSIQGLTNAVWSTERRPPRATASELK